MKQAILNLMLASGAFAPFRLANRSKALILTYHRFSEEDEGASKTSARSFAEQLDYLAAHYTVVPLSLIAERLQSGTALPRGTAAITIDDGYRDAYRVAFPMLRQHRMPATLFAATDFVDRKGWLWTDKLRFLAARTAADRLETTIKDRPLRCELNGPASRLDAAGRVNSALKSLPEEEKEEAIARLAASLGVSLPDLPPEEFEPLTWDEARRMDAAGVEIGSHTLAHPILPNTGDERLRRELHDSRARLEEVLGHSVELFCYPNGNMDARVRREVERAGYKCAVTTVPGLNDGRSDPLALRRIPAERDLAHFAQSTSGFEELKNRLGSSSRRSAPSRHETRDS